MSKKKGKATPTDSGGNKKKAGRGKAKPAEPRVTMVAENRKAKFKYEIIDQLECGMDLRGSEVKSLREGKLSIEEAHIRVVGNELWLVGSDIGPYNNAGLWNHDARRQRKLLMHARERDTFAGAVAERGLTLVPLRVYFNARGLAKCVMGLVRGKKMHDKRETLKKRDTERGLQQAMRRR